MERVLKYQGYHLIAYLLIGAALWGATVVFPDGRRQAWGLPTDQLILVSWVLAGLHQGWIAFFWRLELYLGKITAWLGRAGFPVYVAGYLVLGFARLMLVIPIASTSAQTLAVPRALSVALIVVTTPPILWALYSVAAYFGIVRAFGADHWDPSYRDRPLETRGIYRYTSNAMYGVVLLLLYHPALFHHSRIGLIAAAAHQAFVWCHYLFTEKPDMAYIHGPRTKRDRGRHG